MTGDPSDTASRLRAVAAEHGVGLEAARHMLLALRDGGGRMAQFDHPEFGGMGQWFAGGMVMVGRMNDHALKARVSGLCEALSAALPDLASSPAPHRSASFSMSQSSTGASEGWWPEGLGRPSSIGSQNSTRYAWFPETRRLAVDIDGRVTLYDTGEHVITGASQQQSGASGFRFSGPHGAISLDTLTPVGGASPRDRSPAREEPSARSPAAPVDVPRSVGASRHDTAPAHDRAASSPAPSPQTDVIAILERLAELHRKGILTDEEFSAKKAELLARL